MKRIAAVLTLAFAATLLSAAPSQAASLCLSYDVSVNGQGQAQSICLPG